MRRFVIVGLLLSVSACVRSPWARDRIQAHAVDGDARLSDAVTPLRYRLELTIDPTQPSFSGEAWITVRLEHTTDVIRMHAKNLDVRHVEASPALDQAGSTITGAAVRGISGGLALVFHDALPAGQTVIHLFYDGEFAAGLTGLYRVTIGGDSYAFTQFEALHARKAFPCFDEPRFKTPWEVTLRVPHGLLAASNAPAVDTRPEGPFDLVRFAPTDPLPTYLVAFVVGPFDVVQAPILADGVPLRLLTVRGKNHLAHYALDRTPPILAALHDYFGRPYPYQKLDLVAVPDFGAGAMENAGLVTFRETLLLLDRERATAGERYVCESVIAHELAHQWFGNLVTMAWWDDLWLNEGFATWMAAKVLTVTAPEFHADLDMVRSAGQVMQADALAAARAVRQPIANGGDVLNAFDDITYDKGAAILRMLEAWIGEQPFRAAIREYVDAHAWKNARTSDLFAALEHLSGKPIGAVASTFLGQPGTPYLAVTARCDAGAAKIEVRQSRYLFDGSQASGSGLWQVPVCVRYETAGVVHRQCTLVAERTAEVILDQPGCPAWVYPNDGEAGYYRWRLPDAALLDLAAASAARLTAAEDAALPGQFEALLLAAELDARVYLEAADRLLRSGQRTVVEATIEGLGRIYHATVDFDGGVPPAAFARFVRASLGRRGRALGLLPRPHERLDAALLRPRVLPMLADLGADVAVRAQARRLTQRFLTDPRAVPQAAAEIAVPIAALDGDAALHQQLAEKLASTNDPHERATLLSGLGAFRDPTLFQRSLNLYLTDVMRVNEFWPIAGNAGARLAVQAAGFAWLETHFDAVAGKLGDDGASYLPSVGAGFCDAAGRARVQQFFDMPAHQRPGSARNLAQVLERIDQCAHLRARATSSVAAFLSAHTSARRADAAPRL